MKREEAARMSNGIYVVLETVAEDRTTKQLARPGLSRSSLSAPSGAWLKQPGSLLNSEVEFADVTFSVCINYIQCNLKNALYFLKVLYNLIINK
jgi:hypothetical protein